MNWTYNRPGGGEISPYRLGDFRIYEHNSEPFIAPISEGYELDTFFDPGNNYLFGVSLDGGHGSTNVQMDQMTGFEWQDTYLVAVLFEKDTSVWAATYIADTPVGDFGEIVANISQLGAGQYDVFFMLRQENRYYPIPNSPNVNPVILHKFYGNHIVLGNIQASWDENGDFEAWDDVNFDDGGQLILQSLGYVAIKARFNNNASQSLTINSSDFKFAGTSAHDEVFTNENVFMYVSGQNVSSANIPAQGILDVTLVSQNPVLLFNGSTYSSVASGVTFFCEFALEHFGQGTQALMGGQIRYQHGNGDWL